MLPPKQILEEKTRIELINKLIKKGKEFKDIIKILKIHGNIIDQKWVAIGETHLQQGIMDLKRAINKQTDF